MSALTRPVGVAHVAYNAHLRERYEVWIAESRQGLGPTGRVKVQYSSMSCGVFEPSTTAPVRSSTVKSTSDAAKYTVTQSWPPSCHASLTSALAIWICSTRLVRRAPRSRSEEHTSELQSRGHLVCRPLLEKKKREPRRRCSCPALTSHHVSPGVKTLAPAS